MRQIRGDRDNFGDSDRRAWVDLLTTALDALEDIVREDLDTARSPLLRLDLTDALDEIARARAELARHPEGARLALHVANVHLHRLRLAAEYATRHVQGSRKGTATAVATRRRKTARRHAQIRARAATLNPAFSDVAKAKILVRSFRRLSVRQLRQIIRK